MKKSEFPYIYIVPPIWVGRDFELILRLPMSYENYTFESKLQFIDKSKTSFTIVKTINVIDQKVLVQLSLSELQTGELEPDTIAKFDIKYAYNGNTGTILAGEIPIANSIT